MRHRPRSMISRSRLPSWIHRFLNASVKHPGYPLAVAALAFLATATFAFPFVAAFIPAVLIAPRRWLLLGVLSGIASGFGGGVLVAVFEYLGREVVLASYPQWVESERWLPVAAWLHDYGLWALMFIAGSPIPQTPVIFLYSLANPSIVGVMLAIGAGKTVKYVFLAWLTERYPARFIAYRKLAERRKHHAIANSAKDE